jgi:hypothetical protein
MPDLELGVRVYIFLGCAGLLVLWMGLSQEYGALGLIPVLLGLLGIAPAFVPVEWKTAGEVGKRVPSHWMPPLVLLGLVLLQIFFRFPRFESAGLFFNLFIASDLMIAAGLLCYLTAHYRLAVLRSQAVPADPRPLKTSTNEPEVRPAHLFQKRELRWPAIILPSCLLAGQLFWQWVAAAGHWTLHDFLPPQLGMRDTIWRMGSLIWLLGIGTVLIVGAGGIMRLYRFSGDEARMIAQDVLWLETRGEQRRINRWLAWLRRNRGRKSGELP